MRPAVAPLNFEAEFDRVVGAFLPNRVHPASSESSVDGAKACAESIYLRALEIIDAQGVSTLTFRKLAEDLKMSTRTIRKRVGSRERLIRAAIEHYAGTITVSADLTGLWEQAVQEWCQNLYGQLMERPRITELMIDADGRLIDRQVSGIVGYAVRAGIPFDIAHQCCSSLARLTVNEAIARSRGGAVGGELSAQSTGEGQLFDTVRWVVAGVRAESAVDSSAGTRREP